jgi:photosystem II stability/assembly factor-like uncharacterized protein
MPRRSPLHALTAAASLLLLPAPRAAAQWGAPVQPTTAELRGLSVVSAQVVWASGQRGTVLRTIDGGTTWRVDTVPGASTLDFRAIAATSADVAHVLSIGDSSRIYRTTDGGRTWSLRFTSTRKGSFFDAIQFWDARHGLAMSDPVDGRFLIVTTDDGGASWQEMPGDGMPAALPGEGAFAASGTCLVVRGERDAWLVSGGAATARVFHSTDRGRTWSVVDTPMRAGIPSAGIFSIALADAGHGVITGGDYAQPALRGRNVAVTSDSGRTWTLIDSTTSPAGYRSAVAYWPGTNGSGLTAVGTTGTDVSHDGGRRWTRTDSVPYNSLALVSDGGRCVLGWAVGPAGRIGRLRECGRSRATNGVRPRT